MVLVAIVGAVIVAMGLYAKRAVAGRLKTSAESIGPQFSPRWSGFTATTTVRSRARETRTPDGESVSTLLEPSLVRREGYVDDFSNRKLTDEALFE